MDPAALDALPLFAPASDLVPEVRLTETWDGGYQGSVTVTNHGDGAAEGWTLTLFLPEGWTVTDSTGVRVVEVGAGLRAEPSAPWARRIPAGASVTFGLTVTHGLASVPGPPQPPPSVAPDVGAAPVSMPAPVAGAAAGAFTPRWMGFNIGSWWRDSFGSADAVQSLSNLAATGANVVAIVPTRYVADLTASDIFETHQSEPDANVVAMMRVARDLGLAVVLKPHVDPVDFALRHRLRPADPDRFFAQYQAMMVHYARMAQAENADLFVVGTELVDLTAPRHEAAWRALIAAVRAVYDGPLTYAANYGEEMRVPFWDALDYIGVDMYAPLMTEADPTVEQVVAAWLEPPRHDFTADLYDGQPLVEAMARLSARHERPILFTEIGFRSIDGAGTGEAMTHPDSGPVDTAEQAVFYEGFAQAMRAAGAGWLAGVLFWDWSVQPAVPGRPVPDAHGFSVAGKPAATVFRDRLAPLARSSPPEPGDGEGRP
ncbi:glycoside hydrolase family 113 [Roseospira visakhapatnamensis]|uniref:CBM2 domain-containing protein n=1 Tax=Roseospira visakhapatnamensis TaxID=390880 RepID=A0A7W6W8Y8_9PROT|nr:cellulose binding domain-containing protein [Roseospira visakhapatnamensis]MBB4264887.1 hypothetical protein [Roseospira visakhapatnamensis]